MTTIAWDGKTLAVDGQVTSSDIIRDKDHKKLFINVGEYKAIAISGSMDDMLKTVEWIRGGENGEMPPGDGHLLCITKVGAAYSYFPDHKIIRSVEKGVVASGSGFPIAMGAMDAGATAIQAVKIACKRDVYSGGKIRHYKVI